MDETGLRFVRGDERTRTADPLLAERGPNSSVYQRKCTTQRVDGDHTIDSITCSFLRVIPLLLPRRYLRIHVETWWMVCLASWRRVLHPFGGTEERSDPDPARHRPESG